MASWGSSDTDEAKPKWLTTEQQRAVYATSSGWVQPAQAGSGDPEVLVAIRGLAGASATTGLKTATITSFRFSPGTTATTDHTAGSSSQRVSVTITWDEAITVTGNPTVVIANDVSADHTCAYTSGTGTNRLTFQVASQTLATGDVMTIGGANVVLAGGTLKDQGGTPADASLVMSGVTAVTHTVLA